MGSVTKHTKFVENSRKIINNPNISQQKERKIKPSFNHDNRRDMSPRMNNRIIAKSVQVITQDGKNLGIMSTSDALQIASNDGLDLVEINATNVPPIVKIMDYGKFKYEQKNVQVKPVKTKKLSN